MKKCTTVHAAAMACTVALHLCAATADQAQTLFELTVTDVPVENGKRLNMTLRETERAADFSLVEVTFISGGSVSSSMFVLRGMCGIARTRGETYFAYTDEGQSPRRYRVRFPKNPTADEISGSNKKIFTLSDCELLSF